MAVSDPLECVDFEPLDAGLFGDLTRAFKSGVRDETLRFGLSRRPLELMSAEVGKRLDAPGSCCLRLETFAGPRWCLPWSGAEVEAVELSAAFGEYLAWTTEG